ncbi:MAG TPA: AraC family transcriptional regulator [Candidatus Eisenbergiella merdipullorum]|uniref:AraC family transcriptional regulator n=1 Tax=Candidatus Eisenbergiella merdipullorum TaxID=2838553 RepID=A0A9D2I2F4_9FIRM|nr:AraC family transcriptional regulator [Candidatus Eisenbergiella merdipullorum]
MKASILACEGLAEIVERLEYGERGRIDRQISEYMEAHIAERLHVDTVARHFSISPSQLQRLCHQYFNMSAMELYTQKRINKSKVLLRSTENSINEIAGAVGFDELANFSAFFTKSTGMTPSGYRRKRRRSAEGN